MVKNVIMFQEIEILVVCVYAYVLTERIFSIKCKLHMLQEILCKNNKLSIRFSKKD